MPLIRKITLLLALSVGSAAAQTCTPTGGITCTPNLNLNVIPFNYLRYDIPINANTNAIDTLSQTYKGAWSSTVTYLPGQFVTSGGSTYISLVPGNLNHSPSSSPTQWAAIGSAAGVASLNSLTGAVTLAAGSNITLTPSGNMITIAASGGGGSIPSTTNLLAGNGSGNAADSGIVPSNVALLAANQTFIGTNVFNGNASNLSMRLSSNSLANTAFELQNPSSSSDYFLLAIGSAGGGIAGQFCSLNGNTGDAPWCLNGPNTILSSNSILGWASASAISTTPTLGLSQASPGILAIGNGTSGDASGVIHAGNGVYTSGGNLFLGPVISGLVGINIITGPSTDPTSSSGNFDSGGIAWGAEYWNGTGVGQITWNANISIGTGTSPTSNFVWSPTTIGGGTGLASMTIQAPVDLGINSNINGVLIGTASTGSMTSLHCVIGNGGVDSKVDPNCSTDGAGNVTAASFSAVSSVSGFFDLTAGSSPSGVPANSVQVEAPSSVTSYRIELPGTAPTAGQTFFTCTATAPSICSWGAGGTATIASGTLALATGAISSGVCGTAQTATATGAASTDTITFTPNADITAVTGYAPVTAGGLAIYTWPTANTFNLKVCNPTASSITPGAVSINWSITR
ncbi:MAG TPA: hypothetical protein VGK96_28425 [Candidatus Sulfotelmatobacter sp.]